MLVRFQLVVYKGIIESGFEVRANIVWVKNNFAISRTLSLSAQSSCFYIFEKANLEIG